MTTSTAATDLPPTEYAETRLLVEHGFELARSLGITKVLVHAELVSDQKLVEKHRDKEILIWITAGETPEKPELHEFFVEVPGENTNRISQVTLGIIMGIFRGVVQPSESVICLTGLAGSKRLDNLLIVNPKRDYPWFSNHEEKSIPQSVSLGELLQLLTIALRFSSEGREGKPIGTIFVLGDVDELKPYLRPLILNPLEGHLKKLRNIHDTRFLETLRELAALDGAFIVNPKGVVNYAAVYLDAPMTSDLVIAKGLGSRHVAAAALTAKTDSVAVVLSESSGTITVFCRGQEVMTLEGNGGNRN